MALFDFLKKKKEAEKARPSAPKKPQVKSPERSERIKRAEKKEAVRESAKPEQPKKEKPVSSRKPGNFDLEAVREPHISEKAAFLGDTINQYVFKIKKEYNKNEIKKSIEGIYGVDVLSVNIVKIPKKKRRLGRIEGYKKGHTKAIVTIKKGQKIEIL